MNAIFGKIILAIICLFTVASCIDEITLDIDTDQRRIAVDGFISDSLVVHSIGLSYSSVFGVGNDNIQEPIKGAQVVLKDDQDNSFTFEENEEGIYQRLMAGEVGRSYHLEIVLADGKVIRSTPSLMPEPNEITGVNYEIEETTTVNSAGNVSVDLELLLKIDAALNPRQDAFLRWRTSGEYEFHEAYPGALSTKWCYISEDIDFNNLVLVDKRELSGNELKEQVIAVTEFNERFAWQYCFHVSQFSMNQEEYDYWKSIEQIINTGGSLFDPPPGTVIGNFYNPDDENEQILGFFSVSSVSFKRFFCNPDVLNRYIDPTCSFRNFRGGIPRECMDCRTLINSSVEKPSYWIP